MSKKQPTSIRDLRELLTQTSLINNLESSIVLEHQNKEEHKQQATFSPLWAFPSLSKEKFKSFHQLKETIFKKHQEEQKPKNQLQKLIEDKIEEVTQQKNSENKKPKSKDILAKYQKDRLSENLQDDLKRIFGLRKFIGSNQWFFDTLVDSENQNHEGLLVINGFKLKINEFTPKCRIVRSEEDGHIKKCSVGISPKNKKYFIGFKAEITDVQNNRNHEEYKQADILSTKVMIGDFGLWVYESLQSNNVHYKLGMNEKLDSFVVDEFVHSMRSLDTQFIFELHNHHLDDDDEPNDNEVHEIEEFNEITDNFQINHAELLHSQRFRSREGQLMGQDNEIAEFTITYWPEKLLVSTHRSLDEENPNKLFVSLSPLGNEIRWALLLKLDQMTSNGKKQVRSAQIFDELVVLLELGIYGKRAQLDDPDKSADAEDTCQLMIDFLVQDDYLFFENQHEYIGIEDNQDIPDEEYEELMRNRIYSVTIKGRSKAIQKDKEEQEWEDISGDSDSEYYDEEITIDIK